MRTITPPSLQEEDAELDGRNDFLDGKRRETNPYTPKTMYWMCWNLGWDIAKKKERKCKHTLEGK